MKRIYSLAAIVLVLATASCGKHFLEQTPQGQLTTEQLATPQGVEDALVGAYGLLNGNISGTWGNYAPAPSQWLFGDVAADNAHKGSSSTDQSFMNDIEHHVPTTVNDNLAITWENYYEGIIRCNSTISLLATVQKGSGKKVDPARATVIQAEAQMLRAHYYFMLYRLFVHVPYIDETTTTADAAKMKNDQDVLPKIVADLQFAVANLPDDRPLGEVGRSNKLVAQAYLGKVLLWNKQYPDALTLFKTVIAAKPDLTTMPFQNNFNIGTKNSPECIFTVQDVINSDGSGDNANVGDMLAGFYGTAVVNCCGFSQPSIDLVNSFRTDPATGLPLLDNSYRTSPYTSDMLITDPTAKANYKVDEALSFDPRVDYTAGRRGVQFRDWGVMPGDAWIRDPAYAGPFVGVKAQINQADFTGNTVSGGLYITSQNVNIIRLADVYLMAAEAAIETGDLGSAMGWINKVRARAATLPAIKAEDGGNAAAYKVSQYTSFPSADYARNALHFERRMELAMEGSRWFDLVRWGIAKQVIESYSAFEGKYLPNNAGITFDATKNTYYPIPQAEMDRSNGALTQNSGY
jgi:hypothetical protein